MVRPNIRFDADAQVAYHEAIETSRHVVLNTPPHESFHITQFNVGYTVGQALWTTFPIMYDAEDDGAAPWNLVSFDYVEKTESMPKLAS